MPLLDSKNPPAVLQPSCDIEAVESDEEYEADEEECDDRAPAAPVTFEELTLRQVQVRKHLHTACLGVLALTAFGFLLVSLRPILVPFVLAIMLTYTLTPMVDILTAKPRAKGGFRMTPPGSLPRDGSTSRRRNKAEWQWYECVWHNTLVCLSIRLPRWLAIIMALIIAAVVVTGVGAIIASSLTELSQNAEKYKDRVHQMLEFITGAARVLNIDISQSALSKQLVSNNSLVSPVSDLLMRTVSVIFDELSNGFLMLLFTAYMLLGYQPHRRMTGIRAEMDRQVKRYIGCKVLLSVSTGTLVGLVLMVLGVDLALVFGLTAFLLNFIPNVGSIISTLLPMPIVLFDPSKTWFDAVLTIVVPGTIQMVIGNVVEPRVFGNTMELHPVTVLLTLMMWGSLWGVVGMLLSVPMTAVLKIYLDSLDHPLTNFCARLMEGRPDTSPHPRYLLSSLSARKSEAKGASGAELAALVESEC